LNKYFNNIIHQIDKGELKFKGKGLINRDDQGDYWWELRSCIYYEEFEKEKIIYPNMTKYLPFVYDNDKFYTNQKCYILTPNYHNSSLLKYFTAYLNSSLSSWLIRNMFPELQGGTREINENIFRNFPVMQIEESTQNLLITLVDKILLAKKQNPHANTKQLEDQIDILVYKLYNLTYEEIKIIDPAFALTEKEYENFKVE
jgi:hypothetical protein